MMVIMEQCKYQLPCGLCELKKEPCTMTFHEKQFLSPSDNSRSPITNPFMNREVTCDNSSAQSNTDTMV